MSSTARDPVKALRAADRDGLLTYHGLVAGQRYEIVVAGQEMILPESAVPGLVERLRSLAQLWSVGADVQLARIDGDHYELNVAGRRLRLAAEDVPDWSRGYLAAVNGDGQEHAGVDQIEQIGKLFDSPSLNDQCRFVLLGLMHGGAEDVSADKLRNMIAELPDPARPGQKVRKPAKKTLVGALGFGANMAAGLRENMIRAFGLEWSVAGSTACRRPGSDQPANVPEMPGLMRLRYILAASRAGWVRYLSQPKPNKARWLRTFELALGRQVHLVSDKSVIPWLNGVAAFHGYPEATASAPADG